MDIALLVNLTSKAWSLKILALMDAGLPGRQAPLLAETSATRSAFASSLDHLTQLGLIEKNTGHGHPLRPEIRLTDKGFEAARMAGRIIDAVPDEESFSVIRRNWSVPVLAVTETPQRYSMIKAHLGTVTDRALSISLGALEEREWLRRDIDLSQRSPFPIYQAANTGRDITKAIRLGI